MKSKFNIVLSKIEAEAFKQLLKKSNINYETSSYYESIYFDILATEEEAETINNSFESLFN